MSINKKAIPLNVLGYLESYYDKKSDLFYRAQPNEKYLVKFIDNDPNSDFYFEIRSYNVSATGGVMYSLYIKPESIRSVDKISINLETPHVVKYFDSWADILDQYTQRRSPYAPNFILKQYEQEFFTTFEIIDNEADTKSYDYNTQLKIELFLEEVNAKLEEVKTEENKIEIEEIQKDVIDLKNTQTKLTKGIITKRFSVIFSKCRKHSLKLAKYIFELVVEKLTDSVVKALINQGS